MQSILFSDVRTSRRIPDPNFFDTDRMERHVFYVPILAVPENLPTEPNPRVPNVSRRIYKDIEKSLRNEDVTEGTFHLKHKGITLIADKVDKGRTETELEVHFSVGQGIIDGGHTYELIQINRKRADLPPNQFIKFEVLTRVPSDWISEIAGGLNTALQVQAMSLDNLAGSFDWMKNELESEPYFDKIAWVENAKGDFDARDLVSILTCFNIFEFPNDQDSHPIEAYEKKANALKRFEQNPSDYERMRPMLKEMLRFHDIVRRDSRDIWNRQAGGKFGGLSYVEKRTRGEFEFPFTGKTGEYRLMNGALFPLLGAFRWMVEIDSESGNPKWKGGFDNVLRLWKESAEELLRTTQQASDELGRNPNAIGKSRNHWANLHSRVVKRDLMSMDSRSAETAGIPIA